MATRDPTNMKVVMTGRDLTNEMRRYSERCRNGIYLRIPHYMWCSIRDYARDHDDDKFTITKSGIILNYTDVIGYPAAEFWVQDPKGTPSSGEMNEYRGDIQPLLNFLLCSDTSETEKFDPNKYCSMTISDNSAPFGERVTNANDISIGSITLPPSKSWTINLGQQSGWNDCITIPNYVTREEVKNMINGSRNGSLSKMVNFDFGAIRDDSVALSPYGLAVKSEDGHYVSWDAENHSMMDVEILNMSANGMIFKLPVALTQVKKNDMILHNGAPCYVLEVHESTLKVVNVCSSTENEIYPVKSPFGFNFITKVVTPFDFSSANKENPFGNPLMMLALCGGLNGEKNEDFFSNPLMLFALGSLDAGAMAQNPWMMLALLGKDGGNSNDVMTMWALSGMMGNGTNLFGAKAKAEE